MSLYNRIKKGYKSFKESVTAPRMSIALTLPKDTYFPGEELDGSIIIDSHEHCEIDQAVIRLYCTESLKKVRRISSGDASYDREYTDTAILYDRTFPFSLKTIVEPDQRKVTPFKIAIPITARPTFASVNSNLTWELSLEVQIMGRPSLNQMYSIVIGQESQASFVQKETIREIEVIYCSHCGTKNNARTSFCTRCGAPLH